MRCLKVALKHQKPINLLSEVVFELIEIFTDMQVSLFECCVVVIDEMDVYTGCGYVKNAVDKDVSIVINL